MVLIAVGSGATFAGFLQLPRYSRDVWHDDLVNETAETQPEVGGDVPHGGCEVVAQG